MTKPMLASMAVALVLAANQAAHAETVRSFEPGPTPGTEFTPGVWYAVDVRTGGTAGIVDLTGIGGALENSQPLPTGAATLTTDFTDAAKAEVGVFGDYGNFMQALASLTLTYSYFKKTNTGQNLFAAPALHLVVRSAGCEDPDSESDCYGSFVYEPYWNGATPGTVSNLTLDEWIDVGDIDMHNGVFWWSGGFGEPSGSGGPPLKTLAEWSASFNSADFQEARIVGISIGVGTYNQGQIGYFDKVEVSGTLHDAVYDFEPPLPYETVGECVSTLIRENCAGLRGLNRSACNDEQQSVCFEVFGVK